ncbi:MAG TPA: S9 family peptidase, partial [Phenylobacterium sp.]|nr:S9 family peptidase [Phenylobacterium sp.]
MFALGAPPALAAPLDAYGKLPSIEGMAISPDGAHLATIVTDGEKRSVQIMTFADRKAIALPAGDAKLRGVMWADPTHVVG